MLKKHTKDISEQADTDGSRWDSPNASTIIKNITSTVDIIRNSQHVYTSQQLLYPWYDGNGDVATKKYESIIRLMIPSAKDFIEELIAKSGCTVAMPRSEQYSFWSEMLYVDKNQKYILDIRYHIKSDSFLTSDIVYDTRIEGTKQLFTISIMGKVSNRKNKEIINSVIGTIALSEVHQ